MRRGKHILGIDIGSVSVAVAEVTPEKHLIRTAYKFHCGDWSQTLTELLGQFYLPGISRIVSTASTPDSIKSDDRIDNLIAIISAAKHRYSHNAHFPFRYILNVGGERFGLVEFDEKGNYLSYKGNTSCAAGTGSFLDQQVVRLNLTGIEQLSDLAFNNTGRVPHVASRCAVFAKTDLIHAQQEGYTLGEISAGLCLGLAKNITDTLFNGENSEGTVLFCGGVSKNRTVAEYIGGLTGLQMRIDDHCAEYGAIGSAIHYIDEVFNKTDDITPGPPISQENIIGRKIRKVKSVYPPLVLEGSDYPDFENIETHLYTVKKNNGSVVEVDFFETFDMLTPYDVYLGIDIGSTSTKAVFLTTRGVVLCGFYTRTSGRPVDALCSLFEAMDWMIQKKGLQCRILGAGTTGSGRKLVGKIINADLVLDEISAHARAACELDPNVDTIIEIGGQDAKFTALKNKMVTTAVMNNVCAAGTGSFIEEQALRLGCQISEYATRTQNQSAPMSSDRCTVFMERDINYYLGEGFTVDAVLASALHSVRDNYLLKVAIKNQIGERIYFQGATAKNRALVAAFEQKLNQPVHVSKYCHLTGALGTALTVLDEHLPSTSFRGIDLYKTHIPVRSEICELCTNHCKLTIADIGKEQVAYGFLCGRDYNTRRYVDNNSSGFDMGRAWKKAFSRDNARLSKHRQTDLKERVLRRIPAAIKTITEKNLFALKNSTSRKKDITVGIPAALYLYEDIPFWQFFFRELGIKTVTSEKMKGAVKTGKNLTRSEFCAPIAALHGHVNYLLKKADVIFLPFYIENKQRDKDLRRQYCYCTQFIPAIINQTRRQQTPEILSPVIRYLYTGFHTKKQLYIMLKSIFGKPIPFLDVSSAYDKALEFKKSALKNLMRFYVKKIRRSKDISVVLIGRPYMILPASENKGIPEMFATMGIQCFYQDMVSDVMPNNPSVLPLSKEVHWHFASKIIETVENVARTHGVYPVFITAFKCAPDSFIKDDFRRIMEGHDKPYLILELDEHDSSIGYETRIEAAVRSFRNHDSMCTQKFSDTCKTIRPEKVKHIGDKTIVLPAWDSLTCGFLAANLQREGINAVVMEETEGTIRRSMTYNTGQCIPLNAIAQGYVEYIEKHGLDPARTLLWMSRADMCSLRLYPHAIKNILNTVGNCYNAMRSQLKKFFFPSITWKYLIRLSAVAISAVILFSTVIIPFRVMGFSMEPTYLNGRFNFCFRQQYLFSEPKRHDVVVIRMAGEKVMLLKRVVAMGGEVVEFRQGMLFVDGRKIVEPYVRQPSTWNLPPRLVRLNHVYVVGDNRNVPINVHQFGQTTINRIVGAPLW